MSKSACRARGLQEHVAGAYEASLIGPPRHTSCDGSSPPPPATQIGPRPLAPVHRRSHSPNGWKPHACCSGGPAVAGRCYRPEASGIVQLGLDGRCLDQVDRPDDAIGSRCAFSPPSGDDHCPKGTRGTARAPTWVRQPSGRHPLFVSILGRASLRSAPVDVIILLGGDVTAGGDRDPGGHRRFELVVRRRCCPATASTARRRSLRRSSGPPLAA